MARKACKHKNIKIVQHPKSNIRAVDTGQQRHEQNDKIDYLLEQIA